MQFQRPTEHAPAHRLRALPPATTPEPVDARARRLYLALAVAAIGLGVLVRATIVLASDFPLNDGGMFFAMVRDLQASHYALPSVTTYNSASTPRRLSTITRL